MSKVAITRWVHLVALLPLFFVASGCVAVARNYLPERTDISEPPLDTVTTAYVGDNIVRQGQFTQHAAIFCALM
jgi:hypothetical protein